MAPSSVPPTRGDDERVTEGPVAVVILPSCIGGKTVAVPFVVFWRAGASRRSLGVSGVPEGGGGAFRAISRGACHPRLAGGAHEGVSPIPAGPRQPMSVAPH